MIEELLGLFGENGIRYCVIGGQAVNHYAGPLVSWTSGHQPASVEAVLAERFEVRRFPHSLDVTPDRSNPRIQTYPRYADFVDRAGRGDVLRGKVWAAQAPSRRPDNRRKDLLEIGRPVEAGPALRGLAPRGILARFEP